jgi:hypothetical protein
MLRTLRFPARRTWLSAPDDGCPHFARAEVDAMTRELEALGFERTAERARPWRVGDEERTAFVRFLTHVQRNAWLEIHVNENPRSVTRVLKSVIEGSDGYRAARTGTVVATGDKQADAELFKTPNWITNRILGGSSAAAFMEGHEACCTRLNGLRCHVADAVALAAAAYDDWIDGLVRAGHGEIEGGWMKIRPSRMPGAVARTWSGFLG